MRHLLLNMIFVCGYFGLFSAEIAVVTLAVGEEYKEIVKDGIDNKKAYCNQHGYDFIVIEETLDPNRPVAWSKILAILNLMENQAYKWIFWTDADALIMNLATDLEDLTDDEFDFIISKDFNGYNNGHFLIKNCEHSKRFFNQVYSHTELIHDGFKEQEAITKELQNQESLARTKVIPQRLFNSYAEEFVGHILESTFEPGDFIIHFAGVNDKNQLRKLFEIYSPKVVNAPELPSLQQYYRMYGVLNSPKRYQHSENEKEFYVSLLQKTPNVRNIVQILLRDGQLAETFFQNCRELTTFIAFDLNNLYSLPIADFFHHKYPKQFKYIPGGFQKSNKAQEKIMQYASEYPEKKFDLIHFEGGLGYYFCFEALKNAKNLAHNETCLWIKNYHLPVVQEAIMNCVKEKILEIIATHEFDGLNEKRLFLEAKYSSP
jgi:hypothetical protein